jgi:hypothetical protein
MRRFLDFWMLHQTEFTEIMLRAPQEGISLLAHPTSYDAVAQSGSPSTTGALSRDNATMRPPELTDSIHWQAVDERRAFG